MHNKNYLILDIGASSGRAIVAIFDGEHFRMEETYRFENVPVYAAGTLYWDILRLYSELKNGIQASTKKYSSITSMAIDTWGDDFGFIDKNGVLISNPVHYRDEKRVEAVSKVHEIIPELELFRMIGGPLAAEVSIYHMYSLKLRNATELISADKFLMIPDIFNYFLTGATINEFTNATTTLMFDSKEKKWSYKLLDKLGIPRGIFSDITLPGTKIGTLQTNVSKELGIPPVEVVTPCSHDTASAVAGIPVAGKTKNWAFISVGTWCVLGVETNNLVIKDEIVGTGFLNEGGAEGLNLFVKDINGLWIIQQCREKWIKDKGKDISWDDIVIFANKAKPFKSFIDVDHIDFFESQVDMPEEVRKFCTRTGQKVPEDMGEVARCVYESLAFKFRYSIENLKRFTGMTIDVLHLVGGGIANKSLCQWTASAIGVPVIAGPEESTSVGNLLMQLKGTGEISTLKEGRQVSLKSSNVTNYEPKEKEKWDEAYSRYLKLFS